MFADRHYTPTSVALELVTHCAGNPQRIADFCVGDGSLVRAAATWWECAHFFICDVDPDALHAARTSAGKVAELCFDFLSPDFPRSTTSSGHLLFDLILLNPPFSNRGQRRWSPRGRFAGLSCSQAFAFLLTSLEHLSKEGEILAILPSSVLSSEQDENARKALRKICSFELLSSPRYGAFPNVDASTFMARLKRLRHQDTPPQSIADNLTVKCAPLPSVKRGTISVRRRDRVISSSGLGWVHTTSIVDGKITARYEFSEEQKARRYVSATRFSVLIPRVGRVRPGNLAVLSTERDEVISDCLFAVACESFLSANLLHNAIIDDFAQFRMLYLGTGAPYLTIARLTHYLISRDRAAITGIS